MKAILIGAGRGRRLSPFTDDRPKGLVEIRGRRILDWILDALRAANVSDVVYVGGWQIDAVRNAYPDFRYVENTRWSETNILWSLFEAEHEMEGGFICSYVDILYRPEPLRALAASPHAATLVVDTDFRARYRERSMHPENDAEKVRADEERVTGIGRWIPAEDATGEFIGVARFDERGAAELRQLWKRLRRERPEGPVGHSPTFEKAYFIDLLEEFVSAGLPLHRVNTHGQYFEIDTTEDYALATRDWGV